MPQFFDYDAASDVDQISRNLELVGPVQNTHHRAIFKKFLLEWRNYLDSTRGDYKPDSSDLKKAIGDLKIILDTYP